MKELAMTTLTLKNVPEEVYLRLKSSAELNKRSINSEAIICLQTVLTPGRFDVDERIKRARALREQAAVTLTAQEVDDLKREGRQ